MIFLENYGPVEITIQNFAHDADYCNTATVVKCELEIPELSSDHQTEDSDVDWR